MRRVPPLILTLLGIVALIGQALPVGFAGRANTVPRQKPRELIVKLKDSASAIGLFGFRSDQEEPSRVNRFAGRIAVPLISNQIGESLKRSNGRVHRVISARGLDRIVVVEIGTDEDPAMVIRELSARDDVEWVEANLGIKLGGIPNDPSFVQQWAMQNRGFGVGEFPSTAGADIKASEAWDVTEGEPAIRVAVSDTGIDRSHPELEGRVYTNAGEVPDNGVDDDHNGYVDDVHGFNVADNNGDTSDVVGHGTQMAGLISAISNNEIGIAGVSRATLIPVRFFKKTGPLPEDFDATVADAARSLVYAIAAGAQIINASWTTLLNPGEVSGSESRALAEAVTATSDAGVLLICIAGNDGFDNDFSKVYPGAYELPNEIVVGASDFNDAMWHPPFNPFFIQSGFGEKSVHLAAPGVSVITTTAHGDCLTCSQSDNPNDWYVTASGTSLSAALVSGVAALVMTKYPADNVFIVKRRILAGVQHVAPLIWDNFMGKQLVITGGRLDAAGALAATVDVSSPSVTSAKYKKGNEKLILNGEGIQRGVRIFVAGKGYDAKAKGSQLKLVVPTSEIPVGVAVTIKLRNPDGGESPPFIFTR